MITNTNLCIDKTSPLLSPEALADKLPLSTAISETVARARREVTAILEQKDDRLLCIVGPCSIHDEYMALDYGMRLKKLSETTNDKLLIVMRTYFEKPRSSGGWKGFINDPHLDGSMDIEDGLIRARKLLLRLNKLGLPTATEMLDPIVPRYIADLISWTAIGARTAESQTHREMGSSLPMPVGFKNPTNGDIKVAICAVKAAQTPHSFLGIDNVGQACIVRARGNHCAHVVLRGGDNGPNYDPITLRQTANKLAESGLNAGLIVDCSHGNSGKIAKNQEPVCKKQIELRQSGYEMIRGIMLESNIVEGRQDLTDNPHELEYGLSITDECIGWAQTEELIKFAYKAL